MRASQYLLTWHNQQSQPNATRHCLGHYISIYLNSVYASKQSIYATNRIVNMKVFNGKLLAGCR